MDKGGGGEVRMPHQHFPKLHFSNDDVILSNTYGHHTLPLPTYVYSSENGDKWKIFC